MTMRWSPPGELLVDELVPPLVAVLEEGVVVVAMKMNDDGSYVLTWTAQISGDRTLPEVESFLQRVARFIALEPVKEDP